MEHVLQYLWTVSWQTAIVAGVVWLVCRVAGKAPASWKCALWVVVLVKLFLPPVGHLPAGVAFWRTAQPMPASAGAGMARRPSSRAGAAAPRHDPRSAGPRHSTGATMPSPAIATRDGVRSPVAVCDLVLIAWLAGMCAMGLRLLGCCARQSQVVRTSAPAPESVSRLAGECAARMGVRRTPALRLSDSAGAPMLVGLIRPAILLPTETARSCTDGDLFAMLLHELAHIRRVDMAWMWLHQLALILFYFNPAVWLAGREMRRERELACDELVLSRSGISGHDYASGFLSALRLACGVSTSGTALAMAEPIELEKRRLAGMVSGRISRMTHNWLLGLLALVLIGLPTYIGLTPAIDWSAVRVQRVAGPSRAGTMLYFRHPMERQLGDITVSVTGVGRLVDPDPADVYPGETPYQGRLVVEVDARSGSTDMDLMGSNRGPTQLIVGGDELLQRLTFGGEAPMGRSRAQYWFALPARYASKLDRLTFPISYDPRTMPGHFGPFRLSDLSQPRRLKVGDETTLVMADTTEVTLPVGYVDFVKPWNDSDDSYGRPGRPRGGRYLVLRLYTWSHALDHVVLYDDDGRAIPMVEGTETSDAGSILHTSISTAAWDRAHDATDDAPWAPAYLGLQWAGMAWKMMPMPGIDPARVAGMVCTVDPNGPAAKAGIRVGDGLVRMTTKNQIPFGPEVVQDSAGSFADPGVPLRVTILRGGDERTVTLTPARDPMFEGVIERSRSALAKLNMEMPDCRSDRISTYVFVSNSPVRAGLRASKLELWFTGNPATPRDQWREEQVTFRDIPLPKEFWAIQDARSGKSHLPR